MKKVASFLVGLLVIGATYTVAAEESPQKGLVERIRYAEFVQKDEDKPVSELSFSERLKLKMQEEDNKKIIAQQRALLPKVAIMYINNSKSTYNDNVDSEIFKYINRALPESKFELVDGTPYMEKLNKLGYMDISQAERADIMDAFAGEDIDYCIYLEIKPFIARDKVTFFTVGKDITTSVPFKIIDLVNNKYIYVGEFTEKASDSSMIGGIGNKSVALKAVGNIGQKIESVIDVRVPKTKNVDNTNK